MGPRIPRMLSPRAARLVTAVAIVGTVAVLGWMLLQLREDPPRADRGPLAIPSVSATTTKSPAASTAANASASTTGDAR